REDKPVYWKYYDRIENPDRLLEFDHEALAGLQLRTDIGPYKLKSSERNFVYTYTFPEQQHNLGTDEPHCPDAQAGAGRIVLLDDDARELRIKLSAKIRPDALRALIPGKPLRTNEQREALTAIAQAFLDGTLEQRHPATFSLLLARAPRLRTPRERMQPEPLTEAAVSSLIADLGGSHIAMQGPPGSGKSTLAAQIIVDRLRAGRRVGIVAKGHKAIHNLLAKVEALAARDGLRFLGVQKFSTTNEGSHYVSAHPDSWIETVDSNDRFARPHDLAAGTPWLFSRSDLQGAYDDLFIDEAGQLSLADALACSRAARNAILFGDPLQLKAVSQGSHPPGTDLSILQHLLGDRETIDPHFGVFLEQSYRMAPAICSFISEAVYEGRLHSAPSARHNAIDADTFPHSGLHYIPVPHEGNVRDSDEEANAIVRAALALLGAPLTIGDKPSRPLEASDLIVVAPYNAQRKLIRRRLEAAGLDAVPVGTVDKFQGQEAAVVFYSMATSNGATLPRDLEFLFERNRLNVAISRAQCLSVLACSPDLLGVRCSTPEQVPLVNLLCRFVECATSPARAAQRPAPV
ncbi:MAG TPA: DEAD/DEAH box helicase, partial [Candidatus Aquilonibacter sp.]